jgi:hypothetical protein
MLRPRIPVRLANQNQSLVAEALLDTGADVNVLPYGLGVSLGLDWTAQTTALELSGNLAQYEARGVLLDVTIGSFDVVRLGFAWTRAEAAPLLFGQVNFFDEFDVCFLRTQRLIEIRRKVFSGVSS